MKRAIVIFSILVMGVSMLSYEVHAKIALAQVRIQVVDQDGCVVPDAMVWGGFTCGGGMNDFVPVDGVTDTNGTYVAEGKCNELLRFEVRKEGYYRTDVKIYFARSKAAPLVVDGKWQPYGETRTVVLKRIKNPVTMSFAEHKIIDIPVYDKWIAFDMERFLWLPPYGEGKEPDVLIRFTCEGKNMQNDFKSTMQVSFTNNPYAGFYEMKKDVAAEMKSVYAADTNEAYQTSTEYRFERHPGRRILPVLLQDDSYLVFRTRTAVDKDGKLISAHYGKIYGRWGFHGAMRADTMIFNPMPNDMNLEDAETARKSRLWYKQCLEFERRRKAGGK